MADVLAQTPPPGITTPTRSEQPVHKMVQPGGSGYVSAAEAFGTWLGVEGVRLTDLLSLPRGALGQKLVALRFIVANQDTWVTRFAWKPNLAASLRRTLGAEASDSAVDALVARAEALLPRVVAALQVAGPADDAAVVRALADLPRHARNVDQAPDALLQWLGWMQRFPQAQSVALEALRAGALSALKKDALALDVSYLCSYPLDTYPATTVSAGELEFIVVADKGEMGTRAVREVLALKKIPVVVHSTQDDADALQVRIARKKKGIIVGLAGNFRESYANHEQIAARVKAAFQDRFGSRWEEKLQKAALYPGYGPLAENSTAIRHFRREGIAFVGPMQDVVERAGDKRKFRQIAQSIEPTAVTPGLIIDAEDEATILRDIRRGHDEGHFTFPGRVKAANGGGGRGQAVVKDAEGLEGAVRKVLGEIENYAWEAGVMFEQNISETTHLEVQVVRDRYGNARHFGMRDCTEQRASQKIQEEAPPALLRRRPDLMNAITGMAVRIAHQVGYVGAGTVELMWKNGKFYFLEMNTRIQVEHPVTEECHAIRRKGGVLEPLNLVRLQMRIADGAPIDFAQEDVVQTHVGREFRINAESWMADLRDSRDGQRGLFVPNAGVFDEMDVPDRKAIQKQLGKDVSDVKIRFDCGFEAGDTLVNKDPTFGKLIVAVAAKDPENNYELLRKVSLLVLARMRISGRQVMPDGRVIEGSVFKNNIPDHIRILETQMLKDHSRGEHSKRHVNWVVNALRSA